MNASLKTYSNPVLVLWLIPFYACARTISLYLKTPYEPLTRFLVFAVLIAAGCYVPRKDHYRVKKSILAVSLLWSALFSLSLIFGYHLSIKKAYSGTIKDNYITPYSFRDIIAFFLLTAGFSLLCLALSRLLLSVRPGFLAQSDKPDKVVRRAKGGPEALATGGSPVRFHVLFTLLFMLCYLPYLLCYWPGLIMKDSIISIDQAMGWTPLTIAHPVLYTLFIRLCLRLGQLFGEGNTAGCVIYCIIQSAYMAFGFSCLTGWILSHTKAKYRVGAGLICLLVFGFTPYIASYSVAMWKDPAFSISLLLLTLKTDELVRRTAKETETNKNGTVKDAASDGVRVRDYVIYALLIVLTLATRSNGFYALLVVEGCLILSALLFMKKSVFKRLLVMAAICGVLLAGSRIVHGPVYRSFGITEKKEEAVGIFLNQMARAASLGTLSEKDRAYMDALLPFEQYPEVYTPCCADSLKWNPGFNPEALNDGFLGHWFSVFRSNPKLYLEAWEFMTCGFWAVNVDPVNSYARNIQGGHPVNLEDGDGELERCHIQAGNLLKSDFLREIFALNEWAIPVSWIAWLVLFVFLFMIAAGDPLGALPLTPSAGLLLSLLAGSPIWYWPRYGAAVQFLLPFYLLLPFFLREKNRDSK